MIASSFPYKMRSCEIRAIISSPSAKTGLKSRSAAATTVQRGGPEHTGRPAGRVAGGYPPSPPFPPPASPSPPLPPPLPPPPHFFFFKKQKYLGKNYWTTGLLQYCDASIFFFTLSAPRLIQSISGVRGCVAVWMCLSVCPLGRGPLEVST